MASRPASWTSVPGLGLFTPRQTRPHGGVAVGERVGVLVKRVSVGVGVRVGLISGLLAIGLLAIARLCAPASVMLASSVSNNATAPAFRQYLRSIFLPLMLVLWPVHDGYYRPSSVVYRPPLWPDRRRTTESITAL